MRTAKRGFTLIELLVVIAVIGVLIELLIPDVSSVREAAAQAQNDKSQMSEGLCPPPLCASLGVNVTLQFPAIPQTLTPQSIFANGAWVSYDPNFIANGEPFGLLPPGSPGAFLVDIPELPQLVEAHDYRIPNADYVNGHVILPIGRDLTGETFTLDLDGNGTGGVNVVAAEEVPEPATAGPIATILCGVGLLASQLRRRNSRFRTLHSVQRAGHVDSR